MNKHGISLDLARVEIVTRSFNSKGNCVREEWEYYYPESGAKNVIEGFKPEKPKSKNL